ncbi:ATP-binding cassette domain-containing protein [Nocardioides flavescens]|uniref:ATP-binding cassette domain-containing protein n=1 Tax=Nocardioides flavescens TaxID=2691959 RepID=A0A6L7F251_9ACTN|nr:ATP-binding cassette domain-containing protein [Nocardioides flavescens]
MTETSTSAPATAPAPVPALRLHGVSKSYAGNPAVTDVHLEVLPAEVHALVGENGAGKSTLMGIAAGSLAADTGTVEIAGQELTSASPALAHELGLAVVYQHPAILDDLTVLENLLLAVPSARRTDPVKAWARAQLDRVGLDVDLSARASELRTAERQLLEIGKAVALQPKVLVLDEPTESLTQDQVERVFALVAELTAAGTAVIYISHRIAEVRRVADRITTLRNGIIRGTAATGTLTDDDIVEMVVGRALEAVFPPKHPDQGDVGLRVTGLSGAGFRDVDLVCRRGRIVGLAGVEGNGQREVIRALAGLGSVSAGEVVLQGEPLTVSTPGHVARRGVRFIPDDRTSEGLFADLSVRENMTVTHLPALARAGVVSTSREREAVAVGTAGTSIRAASDEVEVRTLSGGNQQKVIFARAMMTEPTLLLCDEPTRGVDVGARREIYQMLRELADDGASVVVLSSDAAELAGLCDDVTVLSAGRVAAQLHDDEVTEQAITGAALRSVHSRHDDADAPVAPEKKRSRGRDPLTWARRSDGAPGLLLLALAVVLAIVTTSRTPTFLGELNVQGLLVATTALGFVALGQLTVVMTGGIDLSAGPVLGLTIIVLSFTATDGGTVGVVTGALIALAVAAGVGLLNAGMVVLGGLPPIVATLATFVAVQGLTLLLRSTPGGLMDPTLLGLPYHAIGPVPIIFIVLVVVAVLAERLLRGAGGRALRATGSHRIAAERLGVRSGRATAAAYVLSSLGAGLAGIVVAGQIGIGDPTQGVSYTLTGITAVVLAGASVYGGRGSYPGVLAGALLLAMLSNASSFLGLDQAWQYWLPGGLMLVATAIAFRARGGQTVAGAH